MTGMGDINIVIIIIFQMFKYLQKRLDMLNRDIEYMFKKIDL